MSSRTAGERSLRVSSGSLKASRVCDGRRTRTWEPSVGRSPLREAGVHARLDALATADDRPPRVEAMGLGQVDGCPIARLRQRDVADGV